ncbi:MAG: hypothetical protein H6711_33250 [Myxococcales bacterium]|nr:hypothetical protein [Myxococcales bacterium]
MSLSWLRAPLLAAAPLLAVATLASGCSAIFNPEKSDDVLRCGNAFDCEGFDEIAAAIDDKRAQAQCNAPGDGSGSDISQSKENQVCSVVDAEIGCDPSSLDLMHIYRTTYEDVADLSGVYAPCADELKGTLGCKPTLAGTCGAGLEINKFGTCDNEGADAVVEASQDNKGLDVRDQFCASFFCDESFVCDGSGSKPLCKRCEDGKPVGEGGCAKIYINGAPSTIYQDVGGSVCESVADTTKVDFGPIPTAP